MNIQHLATFRAIKQAGNITQAAQQLGITQPAVSKRLAALEMMLGKQLFYRIGSGLVLTVAGEILSPASEKILKLSADTTAEIQSLGTFLSGKLEIACSHHIGLYRLPQILAEFKSNFPSVNLQFHFTESQQAYQQVKLGVVDVALLTLPESTDEQIIQELIWDDKMEIMIAKKHPVLKATELNNVQKLLQVPAIFTDDADFTRLRLEQKFLKYQLNKSNNIGINNLELIRMLIESEQGWGVLPITMRNHKLTSIKLTGMVFKRPLGFAYNKQRPLSKTAEEFINILTK
jgi:DNA-binding transcriptional LysR family regulator